MRKKLVSLIREITPYWAESLADYLLINGWTNPVRCKDCINAEYFNGVLCCAMAHDVVRQKTDFCSYGERRTDG